MKCGDSAPHGGILASQVHDVGGVLHKLALLVVEGDDVSGCARDVVFLPSVVVDCAVAEFVAVV